MSKLVAIRTLTSAQHLSTVWRVGAQIQIHVLLALAPHTQNVPYPGTPTSVIVMPAMLEIAALTFVILTHVKVIQHVQKTGLRIMVTAVIVTHLC